VRVFVAHLDGVLADHLPALAVAGRAQRLVLEAPPGQRHHLDAARIEQHDGAGGDPAAEDDAADAEVAIVDADEVLEAGVGGRELAVAGDEVVDAALLEAATDDGVDGTAGLVPDEAQGGDPDDFVAFAEWQNESESRDELAEKLRDSGINMDGIYPKGDDPDNVASGHQNRSDANKSILQGKDIAPERKAEIEQMLNSERLTDNELTKLEGEINRAPNRANTVTEPRAAQDQPDHLSTKDQAFADQERNDPTYEHDVDLTWARILEEYPGAERLPNGDLVVGETTRFGKKYNVLIRRTKANRFMVYVMQTDKNGNRFGMRIGNTEWHSYEALESRIQNGQKLINGFSPQGSMSRRNQPVEPLGKNRDLGSDILSPYIEGGLGSPTTGDETHDRIIGDVVDAVRRGEAPEDILANLRATEMDHPELYNEVLQAFISRAFADAKPEPAEYQLYDGSEPAVGQIVDWTNWHEFVDWWLPDGRPNPNKKPNKHYREMRRGRIVQKRNHNTDGKGRNYGDHVIVQWWDEKNGKWSEDYSTLSAQTLKPVNEGDPISAPFFSKKQEWRSDPEALVKAFGLPAGYKVDDAKTTPRPKAIKKPRTLKIKKDGTLMGYPDVVVPGSQADVAEAIQDGKLLGGTRNSKNIKPGEVLVGIDDDGNLTYDVVLRVEKDGDRSNVHVARPTGDGRSEIHEVNLGPEDLNVFAPGAGQTEGFDTPEVAQARPAHERGTAVRWTNSKGGTSQGIVIDHDDQTGRSLVLTPTGQKSIRSDVLEQFGGGSNENRAGLLDDFNDKAIPYQIRKAALLDSLENDYDRSALSDFPSRGEDSRGVEQALSMTTASPDASADVLPAYADNPQPAPLTLAAPKISDLKNPNRYLDTVVGPDETMKVLRGEDHVQFMAGDVILRDRHYFQVLENEEISQDDMDSDIYGDTAGYSRLRYIGAQDEQAPGPTRKMRDLHGVNPYNLVPGDEEENTFGPFFAQDKDVLYRPSDAEYMSLVQSDEEPGEKQEALFTKMDEKGAELVKDFYDRDDSADLHVGDAGAMNVLATIYKRPGKKDGFAKRGAGASQGQRRRMHSEVLANRTYQALGGKLTGGYDEETNTYFSDAIDGEVAMDAFPTEMAMADAIRQNFWSSNAWRIGLMDILTGERDRHPGNWFLTSDGNYEPTDHGETPWGPASAPLSPFATNMQAALRSGNVPLSPAQLLSLKNNLVAARSTFAKFGRLTWYNNMMKRFESFEQTVNRKGNR